MRSSRPSTPKPVAPSRPGCRKPRWRSKAEGQNLSYAIGNFEPTFKEYEGLFRVLNSQKLAVGKLFSNGTKTFEALRGREGELVLKIVQFGLSVAINVKPALIRQGSKLYQLGIKMHQNILLHPYPPSKV